MSNYHRNKDAARTRNTEPTMTAQDQANDTDINVIIKRHRQTGIAPGASREPMYADFAKLPRGLRDMIHQAQSIPRLREQLPKELAELPTEELVNLTPEKLTSILTPPAKPAGEEKKEIK